MGIDDAPKVAVGHALSKIRPHSLRRRISNDLKLAHADKKRDFKEFREHCLTLARALALLDYNGSNAEKSTDVPRNNIDNSDDSHGKRLNAWEQNCPHPNCKKQTDPKKKQHKIADCPNCNTDEDRQVLYDIVRSRRDTPANNTRSQTNGRGAQRHTSGRLATATDATDASIKTILKDEDATSVQ